MLLFTPDKQIVMHHTKQENTSVVRMATSQQKRLPPNHAKQEKLTTKSSDSLPKNKGRKKQGQEMQIGGPTANKSSKRRHTSSNTQETTGQNGHVLQSDFMMTFHTRGAQHTSHRNTYRHRRRAQHDKLTMESAESLPRTPKDK